MSTPETQTFRHKVDQEWLSSVDRSESESDEDDFPEEERQRWTMPLTIGTLSLLGICGLVGTTLWASAREGWAAAEFQRSADAAYAAKNATDPFSSFPPVPVSVIPSAGAPLAHIGLPMVATVASQGPAELVDPGSAPQDGALAAEGVGAPAAAPAVVASAEPALATLGRTAAAPSGAALVGQAAFGDGNWSGPTIDTSWEKVNAGMLHAGSTEWSSHYAQDCFDACGGAGMCEGWCGAGMACCRHDFAGDPPECVGVGWWPTRAYHTCVHATVPGDSGSTPSGGEASSQTTAPSLPPAPAPLAPPSPAPLPAPTFSFYVYRAKGNSTYPFGNVNAANVPGVLWYLANEVMHYGKCPRRYGIYRIQRYLVTTKATPELYARGMNFGVRYSFDHGECTGSNVRVIGPCDWTWKRFGHVVGCNKFESHYPWPVISTEYPDGVWYSFPSEGRCPGSTPPDGTWNCTWNVKDAGEILLSEIEGEIPGKDYCCDGNCTDFWRSRYDQYECRRRVAAVYTKFSTKFLEFPVDAPAPDCDFIRSAYWD